MHVNIRVGIVTNCYLIVQLIKNQKALADLHSKILDAVPLPPPRHIQILSISCSLWENLAKLCVNGPPSPEGSRSHLEEILDPPLEGTETNSTKYFMI